MTDEHKPLGTAGSYNINELSDDFDPTEFKLKAPEKNRGSFTILPKENDLPDNLNDEHEDSFKDHDHSFSNYEECNEFSHQIDDPKASFNIDEPNEHIPLNVTQKLNPNSSYVIKNHDVEEEEVANYDSFQEEDNNQQKTLYSHSINSNNEENFGEDGVHDISRIDDQPTVINKMLAANEELVNKSFTINDLQNNDRPAVDCSDDYQQSINEIKIAKDDQLYSSFEIPDPTQTFKRTISNKNENRQLSDSYTIPETSEKTKNLLKEIASLKAQIKQMNLCIQEYEKFLNLTLQNKQKSEGSNNISMSTLLSERDKALEEAANIGKAYTDLLTRYEMTKEMLKNYKKNESTLSEKIKEMDAYIERQDQSLKVLKQKAEEKIVRLNQDMITEKKNYQTELERLQMINRFQEGRIQSLESELRQKIESNDELTRMCEQLIKSTENEE